MQLHIFKIISNMLLISKLINLINTIIRLKYSMFFPENPFNPILPYKR